MNLFGGDAAGLNELLTPEQLAAMQRQGALSMAAQLLAASGPSRTPVSLGQALGQSYLAGQQGYSQAQQQALTGMLTKQKIDEYKREKNADAAWRQMLSSAMSPQTAAQRQPGMAPIPGTMTQQPVAQTGVAGQAQMLSPVQLALLGRMPAKEGQAKMLDLVSQQDPEIIRTMRALGMAPTPQNYMSILRAKSTNVNLPPGQNQFISGLGGEASKILSTSFQQAQNANETLANIDRMAPVLSEAVTGPMADARTFLLRVGSLLNVSGENVESKLASTRQLVQGLASQELTAAAAMKGQGQITEGERALIRRMSIGDQSMSAAELRRGMGVLQKVALWRQDQYEKQFNNAMKVSGAQDSGTLELFRLQRYQPVTMLSQEVQEPQRIQVGDVQEAPDGTKYRYKGGDPNNRENWEPVQ